MGNAKRRKRRPSAKPKSATPTEVSGGISLGKGTSPAELAGVILALLGSLILASLISYDPSDLDVGRVEFAPLLTN